MPHASVIQAFPQWGFAVFLCFISIYTGYLWIYVCWSDNTRHLKKSPCQNFLPFQGPNEYSITLKNNQQINRQWMIPDRFTSTHLHQKWIRSTTQTAVTWPTVVVVVFLVLLQLRPNLGLILCAPLSWSEVRLRGSFSCFSSCLSSGTSWPWLLRPVTHRATHLRLWFWPSTSRYSSPMNRHDAEPHNCSSASNLKTNQFTPKTFIPPCVQIVFLSKSAVV